MSGQTPTVNNRYVIPDLAELLSRRMRDISARMNCVLIGTIQTFNSTNQTVTVLVNFQKTIRGVIPLNGIGESADQVINYPTLVNVPIVFMQGGGAYLTFPIAAGDTCLLLFCDRDMDIWFANSQVAPPNSDRVHDINDAIAIVGIRDTQHSLANYNTSIISLVDSTGERTNQSGFGQAFFGTSLPSGWLWCDGSSYLRTTYPLLFAAIGTTYGAADGTHFNVPDMRRNVPAGYKSGDPDFGTFGATIGEAKHLLTGPESGIQQHSHPMDTDKFSDQGSIMSNNRLGAGFERTINTGTTGDTNAVTAHNNIQPTVICNWIIKI